VLPKVCGLQLRPASLAPEVSRDRAAPPRDFLSDRVRGVLDRGPQADKGLVDKGPADKGPADQASAGFLKRSLENLCTRANLPPRVAGR
jgi:hypothetical protein